MNLDFRYLSLRIPFALRVAWECTNAPCHLLVRFFTTYIEFAKNLDRIRNSLSARDSNSHNRRAHSKALGSSTYEHLFFPTPNSSRFTWTTVSQSANSGQIRVTEPKLDNVQPNSVSAASANGSQFQQAKSHAAIITRGFSHICLNAFYFSFNSADPQIISVTERPLHLDPGPRKDAANLAVTAVADPFVVKLSRHATVPVSSSITSYGQSSQMFISYFFANLLNSDDAIVEFNPSISKSTLSKHYGDALIIFICFSCSGYCSF
jgi:hypothetical protein